MHLAYCCISQPAGVCFDLHQRIGRASVGSEAVYPTLVPNCCIWDVSLAWPVLGLECLALQGFPLQQLHSDKLAELGLSDSILKDLAGNSFAAPCFFAVLMGLHTLPFGGIAEPSG